MLGKYLFIFKLCECLRKALFVCLVLLKVDSLENHSQFQAQALQTDFYCKIWITFFVSELFIAVYASVNQAVTK